jgi:hypothetical protein
MREYEIAGGNQAAADLKSEQFEAKRSFVGGAEHA